MVNIQFLMSGKQFIVNAEAGSATTPALATKLTQDQRIAAFFAQTSQAAAAAKTARKGMCKNDLAFFVPFPDFDPPFIELHHATNVGILQHVIRSTACLLPGLQVCALCC